MHIATRIKAFHVFIPLPRSFKHKTHSLGVTPYYFIDIHFIYLFYDQGRHFSTVVSCFQLFYLYKNCYANLC